MTDEETIVMSEDSIRQEAADAAVAAGVDEAAQAAALEQATAAEQAPAYDEGAGADADWGGDEGTAQASAPPQASVPPAAVSEPPPAAVSEPPPAAVAAVSEPEVAPAPEPAPEAKSKKKKKKRKIDLKSRLSSVRGKARPSSTGRKPTASFPPPPTGAVPAPKILGGIAPKISSPFAPPEPEVKPTAQQQTIKVEMGEEILAERKKASSRTRLYATLVGIVTLLIGIGLGTLYSDDKRATRARDAATKLAEEVDEANKTVIALSDAVTKAGEQFGQGEFPAELADVLKTSNVPFTTANFRGKDVGGLPPEVLGSLLRYANDAEKLNKAKDNLQNALGPAKKAFEEAKVLKEKPVVNFSIIFSRADKNIVASLGKNKKPFLSKDKWPETYTVERLVGKKTEDAEVVRYVDGNKLFGDKPVALPIEERTIAGFTPNTKLRSLRTNLRIIKSLTDGIQSPRPDESTNGLIKDGEGLVKSLKKTGAK